MSKQVLILYITWDSESTETNSQGESGNGGGFTPCASDNQEEEGLHSETTTVENFSNVRRRQNVVGAQVIGQLSSDRNDDGHHQVRQSCECSYLVLFLGKGMNSSTGSYCLYPVL